MSRPETIRDVEDGSAVKTRSPARFGSTGNVLAGQRRTWTPKRSTVMAASRNERHASCNKTVSVL